MQKERYPTTVYYRIDRFELLTSQEQVPLVDWILSPRCVEKLTVGSLNHRWMVRPLGLTTRVRESTWCLTPVIEAFLF